MLFFVGWHIFLKKFLEKNSEVTSIKIYLLDFTRWAPYRLVCGASLIIRNMCLLAENSVNFLSRQSPWFLFFQMEKSSFVLFIYYLFMSVWATRAVFKTYFWFCSRIIPDGSQKTICIAWNWAELAKCKVNALILVLSEMAQSSSREAGKHM